MKLGALLLLVFSLLQDHAPRARTRTVSDVDKTIEIVLPVSEKARSVTAVISLPEDGVDSIVVSWNERDLSLERRRGNLFLKLLRPAEGDIHVVGESGRLYRLYLRPAKPGEDYDARVTISPPGERRAKRTPAIDLIRAMRLAELAPDMTARSCRGVLLHSSELKITLRYIYDGSLYVGYVLLLKNCGNAGMRVDPSRFSADGLVLIGSKELRLPAGESTLLYLVYWK